MLSRPQTTKKGDNKGIDGLIFYFDYKSGDAKMIIKPIHQTIYERHPKTQNPY